MITLAIGFLLIWSGTTGIDPLSVNDHLAYLQAGGGLGLVIGRVVGYLMSPS